MAFHANRNDEYQTLEEQTYQHLRTGILAGEFPPGTRLVSSTLARTLRVSRITVANALKRLSSEGFVTTRPHREAVVATLDVNDLQEIFLMRHALEDMVLQEAARRVTPDGIADLRRLEAEVRTTIERNDVDAYRALEREFHLQVYGLSEKRLVTHTLMDLWNRLEPYRSRRHTEFGLVSSSIPERVAIISALEQRNGSAAAKAMRVHVTHGHERILETMRSPQAAAAPTARSSHGPDTFVVLPGSLVDAFAAVPDLRRAQGRLYPKNRALAIIVLAMLSGAESRSEIAAWCAACHPAIRTATGLTRFTAPSSATVHRLLTNTGEQTLHNSVLTWLKLHQTEMPETDSLHATLSWLRSQMQSGALADLPARLLTGSANAQSHKLAVRELAIALGGAAV